MISQSFVNSGRDFGKTFLTYCMRPELSSMRPVPAINPTRGGKKPSKRAVVHHHNIIYAEPYAYIIQKKKRHLPFELSFCVGFQTSPKSTPRGPFPPLIPRCCGNKQKRSQVERLGKAGRFRIHRRPRASLPLSSYMRQVQTRGSPWHLRLLVQMLPCSSIS